eukprot:403331037
MTDQSTINQASNNLANNKEREYLRKQLLGNSRCVSDFEKIQEIGEGTYGTVYKAKDKLTGDIVALKKVRMHNENDGFPITSLREINLLSTLNHPNIVNLKEVVVGYKKDSVFLAFEYCEADLANLFSNLLINNYGQLKLADFGLARKIGYPIQQYTPKVVTLWYRAPEILLKANQYSKPIDAWSVGCILAEFLNYGQPILPGNNEIDQFKQICEMIGKPSKKSWEGFQDLQNSKHLLSLVDNNHNYLGQKFKNMSDNCIDLLNQLLAWDPAQRLTLNEALIHPFFTEAPYPCKSDDIRCLRYLDELSNIPFKQR